MEGTIDVVMPEGVSDKVWHACRRIPREEWSGILLYSVEGSIREPSSMRITLRDIVPMHRGTATYTEYAYAQPGRDRHAEYCAEHPEALGWRIGHVHSHNAMPVFFSGTDMEELAENSASHDYYLSLIANNWMEFTAKVAVRGTFAAEVGETYHALDEHGERYAIEQLPKGQVVREKVYLYDCRVLAEGLAGPKVDGGFERAVDEIVKEAEARKGQALLFDGHGHPIPVKTAKPVPTDQGGFALDVFSNALKALGKSPSNLPGFHWPLQKAVDDLAKAARNAPGRAVDALVRAFDETFGRHCGTHAHDSEYNDTLFDFIFTLENYESDHPGLLSAAINRLIEKERP